MATTKTTKGASKSAKNTSASSDKAPEPQTMAPGASDTPNIAPPDPYVQGALNGPEGNAAVSSSTSDASATSYGDKPQQRQDLDVEYFRNMLLQERDRLESEREAIRASGLDMDGALPEEGEGGDEDTADLASAMMDKEMDLAVEEELEDLMSAIDHALQKMEDGTYGICDMSGEDIPRGRLELIPWAALTAENQAMSEGES